MRRGFTLIELLVTMTILVFVTGAALLSVRLANNKRELRQTAERLQSLIYEARSLALAPTVAKPIGSLGYRFHLEAADTFQIWELDVRNEKGVVTQSGTKLREEILPPQFRLTTTPLINDIVFEIRDYGRVTAPTPTGGTVRFTIGRASSSDQVELILTTATGQVELVEQ